MCVLCLFQLNFYLRSHGRGERRKVDDYSLMFLFSLHLFLLFLLEEQEEQREQSKYVKKKVTTRTGHDSNKKNDNRKKNHQRVYTKAHTKFYRTKYTKAHCRFFRVYFCWPYRPAAAPHRCIGYGTSLNRIKTHTSSPDM